MEGQRQIDGDAAAVGLGIHAGTAADFLHPDAPSGVILGVFVIPFIGDGRVYAAVLEVVKRPLRIGRQAGKTASPFHLAHAAAEAHGIGRHHTRRGGYIGELHVPFRSLVKEEGAQINPHAAAHLLVYVPKRLPAQVMDGITGVGGTLGQGFITHIDGIIPLFRDGGPPNDARRFFPRGGCPDLPGRSASEGHLIAFIDGADIGKTLAGVFPFPFLLVSAPAADGRAAALGEGGVVVTDYLAGLDVPLPRSKHHGTGILQHGNEERKHIALGVEVFQGTVSWRTLPVPLAALLVKIAAMALPEGDVAAAQAHRPGVISLHQGHALGLFDTENGRDGLSVLPRNRLRQGGDFLPSGIEGSHLVPAQTGPSQLFYLLRKPGGVSLPERLSHQVAGKIKVQAAAPDAGTLQLETAEYAGTALKPHRQGIRKTFEIPGFGRVLGKNRKR